MAEYNYRDFVRPNIAIELKTLGFNFKCDYFYISIKEKHSTIPTKWYKFPENWNITSNRVSCPTYSEAFNWFFKVKQLFPSIRISPLGVFYYEIWKKSQKTNDWMMVASSNLTELAEIEKISEDCLKRLIELTNKNDI
jgi:hypothetical protein